MCACAASLHNYASSRWRLGASYEEEQPGRTMIPKCPRAHSVKPVFKRQARRSNPCHCTACLPYRLTYFRSARIQWQATLAVRQRRRDATSIADPSTLTLWFTDTPVKIVSMSNTAPENIFCHFERHN